MLDMLNICYSIFFQNQNVWFIRKLVAFGYGLLETLENTIGILESTLGGARRAGSADLSRNVSDSLACIPTFYWVWHCSQHHGAETPSLRIACSGGRKVMKEQSFLDS